MDRGQTIEQLSICLKNFMLNWNVHSLVNLYSNHLHINLLQIGFIFLLA